MGWPRLTFPQGRDGKADPMRIFSAEGRFAFMLSPRFFSKDFLSILLVYSPFLSNTDAESTVEFGRQLGRALNEQYAEGGEQVHIILFYGDLGSGKTTFTRGFIEALPGGENAEVSSPSFTLCNSYPTTPSVIHCDLYRSEGALPDEVDEALDTESGLVLVEWAERIAAENLPPKRLDILFQVCKNNRLVTLSPYGKAAHCVLQKLARLRDSGE